MRRATAAPGLWRPSRGELDLVNGGLALGPRYRKLLDLPTKPSVYSRQIFVPAELHQKRLNNSLI
jgi:hypothetical protein